MVGLTVPHHDTLQEIVHRIIPDAKLVSSWALEGGSSADMTAVEIALAQGGTERLIVRQCGDANLAADPDVAEHEARLLNILADRGLAVPRAPHVDQSCALLPKPFLVIDFLDGEPDYDPTDPMSAALQTAAFMAQLHGLDSNANDLAFVPRHHGPPGYLTSRRDELPESFHAAHALLEERWPPSNKNPPVLLHGDFWPGNLLWQKGRLSAVVDWEDTAIGDPLADLAIARGDMSWGFGWEAMEAFTERYADLTGFDLTALPLWDLRAVLRQAPHAADYAEGWQELGRADITETMIHNTHTRLIDTAMAALD